MNTHPIELSPYSPRNRVKLKIRKKNVKRVLFKNKKPITNCSRNRVKLKIRKKNVKRVLFKNKKPITYCPFKLKQFLLNSKTNFF